VTVKLISTLIPPALTDPAKLFPEMAPDTLPPEKHGDPEIVAVPEALEPFCERFNRISPPSLYALYQNPYHEPVMSIVGASDSLDEPPPPPQPYSENNMKQIRNNVDLLILNPPKS